MIRNGNIIVRYSRVVIVKSLTQIMLLWHQPQILLPDVPPHINDAVHHDHQVLNLMLINMQSIISKKESFL